MSVSPEPVLSPPPPVEERPAPLPPPEERPSPLPPAEERLTALDLIRGVAVLGVLLANLPHFCGPEMPAGARPLADRITAAVTLMVVDGKFITQLSVLFGAGMAIQHLRSQARGVPFAGPYVWRQVLLWVIGFAHVVFLWFGDILAIYAAVSMLAMFAVLLGRGWEKGVIIGGLIWIYTAGLVFLAVVLLMGNQFEEAAKQQQPARMSPDGPPVSIIFGEGSIVDRFEKYFTPENTTRIYRHGHLGHLIEHRLLMHLPVYLMLPLALIWYLGAAFLIGVKLLRMGAFEKHTRPPWLFPRLITLGLVVGVTFHVAAVVLMFAMPKSPLAGFLNFFGALPQALMYLCLLTLWNESNLLVGLQERFRAVGRMALTNYLMQSVLMTLIYNGYGLGLYGRTGLAGGVPFVLAIWALELIWSPIWLRHFKMGPVEWAWRSLLWRPRPDAPPRPSEAPV